MLLFTNQMKSCYFLFSVVLFLSACHMGGNKGNASPDFATLPLIRRDLPEIKKSGELKAITIYNSTGYFLYRGRTMGFEYDLLTALAEELGVSLKISVAADIDELFDMLNRGEADIIAYGLTITEGRKEFVSFTEHHYLTHQVLVQRMPDNWRKLPRYKIDKALVTDPIQLIGDTVHVRKNSSYADRLESLSNEIGGKIHMEYVPGDHTTEEIMGMVADGEIKYTVADENIASINQEYYPQLDVRTAISFTQRVAWAIRKNSPELHKAVNDWMLPLKQTDFYWVTYNKYFKHRKSFKARVNSPFFSKNGGKISRYDDLIQVYADTLGWDWRLLSSLIYQESRFEPHVKSWAGATGLMQVMPRTAREINNGHPIKSPEENLEVGTLYLKQLFDKWAHIRDTVQRIKFTMASYNCGYAHLLDAQRLAALNGKDSLQYDDNVELWLKRLSKREVYTHPKVRYGYVRGIEPFRYVRDIFLRYAHYQQLIPLQPGDTETQS